MDRFFLSKMHSVALCMILRDSSLLSSVTITFDLGIKVYTQDLVKFSWHHFSRDIFKMAELAPALEDVHEFIHCFVERAYFDYVYSCDRVDLLYCFV